LKQDEDKVSTLLGSQFIFFCERIGSDQMVLCSGRAVFASKTSSESVSSWLAEQFAYHFIGSDGRTRRALRLRPSGRLTVTWVSASKKRTRTPALPPLTCSDVPHWGMYGQVDTLTDMKRKHSTQRYQRRQDEKPQGGTSDSVMKPVLEAGAGRGENPRCASSGPLPPHLSLSY
jgi:hypothetical protein